MATMSGTKQIISLHKLTLGTMNRLVQTHRLATATIRTRALIVTIIVAQEVDRNTTIIETRSNPETITIMRMQTAIVMPVAHRQLSSVTTSATIARTVEVVAAAAADATTTTWAIVAATNLAKEIIVQAVAVFRQTLAATLKETLRAKAFENNLNEKKFMKII